MCWINTVDPQAGQIVYSLAMIILPMVTLRPLLAIVIWICIWSFNCRAKLLDNICLFFKQYLCRGASVQIFVPRCLCWSSSGSSATPSPSTRRLSRISLCECQNIFWEGLKISNGTDFLQIWCLSIKLSPGCFGSHQMSWLKNTLIAIVKTVDYQNNPGSLASSISYLVLWKASSRGVGRAGHHQTGSAATSKAPSFPQSGFNPFTTHFLCN